MRGLIRIVVVATLVAAYQVLGALSGSAQVDPCHPVPIDPICDIVQPSPSPSPDGGKKGGKKGGGGKDDKEQQQEEPAADTGDGSADKGDGKKGKAGKGGKKGKDEPPVPTGPFVVSSPNNSQHLVDILAGLERYGVSVQDALPRVVGPFPVAGLSYWTDDWHACRDGCTRFHEGLDIFAEEGTPLVAIADGVVTQKLVGDLSGVSLEIEDANGVQYFYAHLSAWHEPIEVGDQVHVGQVIGYVGKTGNAISTPPHLHLEVQPGGVPVPPKPFVDKWLKIAELRAEQLVAEISGQPLPEASDYRITRLFDLSGGGALLDAGAEKLLALAGVQPTVSSLEVARDLLGEMAYEIDWDDAGLAELAEQYAETAVPQDLTRASAWSPFGPAPTPESLATTAPPEQGD